nr:lysophospholipid acyltransferase family protein [Microbacterium ureisolvens]
MRPLFWLLYRPRIVGRGNVPERGPVLLASNHLAALDTVIIPTSATRPVQFLIKSAYFTGSGMPGRFKRWFFTSIGGVPVYRATGRDARAALDAGSSILRAGSVFAVFPEGSRSRDGKLHEGHGGAAWMARETRAAVVPVGLIGTRIVKPLSHLLPGRPRVEVHFGEPLDLADLEGVPDGKARREITERMMAAIARLSRQERSGSVNATSRD